MQLTKDAKVFYKLYSFWGILALGALPFLEQYGAPIVSQIPAQYQPIASAVLALIVAVLRFVKQDDKIKNS